jgi:hypothetical protein
MVFMDEAGANLAMIRLYARSPRGQRAIGTRPQQRFQQGSLFMLPLFYGLVLLLQMINLL